MMSTRIVRCVSLVLVACACSALNGQQPQQPEQAPPAFVPPGATQAANPAATNPQVPAAAADTATNPQAQQSQPLSDPFRLTEKEKLRVDEILGYWENRSSKVKTYECRFTRWEYDSVFGPPDPQQAKTKSEGIIRYAAPDKGEFKVELIGAFQPAATGQQPAFAMKKSDHDEHWICDGESVFELNGKTKQLREERLPPEMQGKGIAEGPLPFMFGAKKDQLMARYWMKEMVPPKTRLGEYWIEARPKHREDAANFKRMIVILDREVFLPTAMQVFPPNFDGRKNWTRTAYAFNQRKVNDPLQSAKEFLGRFISPQVPRGWKKVVNNVGAPAGDATPMNAQAPSGQAQQAELPLATTPKR